MGEKTPKAQHNLDGIVVVIPVYKETLTASQFLSVNQCFKILGKYPIFIVCPRGFNANEFERIAQTHEKQIHVEEFDPAFFKDISGYNRLMVSLDFYLRFSAFEHMLIYQNDAYVFSDQLEYWTQSEYDYVGAPWFDGWVSNQGNEQIIGAGNGGLSLRNVQTFTRILEKIESIKLSINSIYKFRLLRHLPFRYVGRLVGAWHRLRNFNIAELVSFDDINKKCGAYLHNEDYFWASLIPGYFNKFSVAEPEVAMFFSFENHPRRLFEMTRHHLPFGCHAWEKYDPQFWSDFIDFPAK